MMAVDRAAADSALVPVPARRENEPDDNPSFRVLLSDAFGKRAIELDVGLEVDGRGEANRRARCAGIDSKSQSRLRSTYDAGQSIKDVDRRTLLLVPYREAGEVSGNGV